VQAPLSDLMIDAILSCHEPSRVRWHYQDAFLLAAVERAGERTERADCRRFIRESLSRLVGADGTIAGHRGEDCSLDQISPGNLLFHLYREDGDERYGKALAALRGELRAQPRTRSGGFWFRRTCPGQMWLNGVYMAVPFYAHSASVFGEKDAFHDVAHQVALMEDRARDPRTGLLSHAWDESRRQLWANPETGRSPSFWGRAMGWYAMAVVDVLERLPVAHSDRQILAGVMQRLAGALAVYQDGESGLWFQVVDQGTMAGNFLEASASCMYVYAIAKAVRLGCLSGTSWREIASRAYRGIRERFLAVDEKGRPSLRGTCGSAGLGGSPYRDGTFAYYCGIPTGTNDPRGVASFVLASLEMEAAASAGQEVQ
jgi:unsaturated rhamnogalacturonyl hydrolase